MDNHELAWAAGFFDGEGWAARKERGVQARINQAGLDGVPAVLAKFRRIVGVGRIKGPAIEEGKRPLYWWEATSRPDVSRAVDLIGPWLCPAKRAEFEDTLDHSPGPVVWPGSMSEELSWAGGFFDGEGSTYLEKHRTHRGHFVGVIAVPQVVREGAVVELSRLQAAIGLGRLSGLRPPPLPSRPYRRLRIVARDEALLALHLLLPFIGSVKRAQALRVLETMSRQPELVRGNPAFGAAGARFCLRGHDKWSARMRPCASRGKNRGPQDRRQCLECVREDVRRKRET